MITIIVRTTQKNDQMLIHLTNSKHPVGAVMQSHECRNQGRILLCTRPQHYLCSKLSDL